MPALSLAEAAQATGLNRSTILRAINKGRIRGHHFGEGEYAQSEQLLRTLLTEAGAAHLPPAASDIHATGIQAAPDEADIQSPETYVGYQRGENFASPGGAAPDAPRTYQLPKALSLNQWALAGGWRVESERAVATAAASVIEFRLQVWRQ